MKKIIAMLIALTMLVALAVPAMADEATYTLTINSDVPGHIYEAYQIFAGDLATDSSGREVLSNIKWGASVSDGAALLAEFNTTYNQDAADAAAMAEWIANNVTSDSVTIDAIATMFGKYLGTVSGSDDYEDEKYEITGLAAGYYLVKDQDGSLVDSNGDPVYDAYTKFILRVVKDQTVTPKGGVPVIDKEINDTLNGTYTEHEDFDIADIAYYKWTGTLPSNLAAYDKYFYKFIDNIPTGIVFETIQQIYIEGHDGNVVKTFYDITDTDTTNDTLPAGVTLNVSGKQVTRQADGSFVHSGEAFSDTQSGKVTLQFDDLLALYPQLLNTHKVVVKYTALVSRDVTFEIMINDVRLEYSNDPNNPTGGGHGMTTPDEAYAITFQVNVDKHDADDETKKLEGAEFVLYYTRIENDTPVNYYALIVTEEMIEAGTQINGVTLTDKYLGNIYGWTTTEADASILDTDVNGHLRVGGLDSGTYFLKETKAPAGYNLMETPVQIDIVATFDDDTKTVNVDYSVDSIRQTSNVVKVRNSAGSTLPVTGGIGTTIFYILGAVLVLGAVVMLITRKRMANAN